jgi:chromosome partitioning protein
MSRMLSPLSYGPDARMVDNSEYSQPSLHNDIDRAVGIVDKSDGPGSGAPPIINAVAAAMPSSRRTHARRGFVLTKVISIANQKGGVGKTTCSINLGGALAELGYRVLCVDMDPQANLTVGLGISLSDVRVSMADVLSEDRVALDEIVRPTETDGLSVAPATLELASTEVELFTAIGREMVLRDALEGWADRQFDVVIVDCPPTLGLLTINSLVASSRVIIPVQTQYYAIKGLTALIKVINTIKIKLNHDLEVLGLLPTFFDGRTVLAREMLDNLRELGDHRVFNTMIKQTVKLGEAPLTGKPVTEYATNSQAARAFRDLAQEVIELG